MKADWERDVNVQYIVHEAQKATNVMPHKRHNLFLKGKKNGIYDIFKTVLLL